MSWRLDARAWMCVGLASLSIGVVSGRATSAADEPPAKPAKPAANDGDKLFVVPDGSAKELLDYIEKLRTTRPEGVTRNEQIAFVKKLATAIGVAADKILAGEADDKQTLQALQFKFTALSLHARFGDEEAGGKLLELAKKYTTDKRKEVADFAKVQHLNIRVQLLDSLKVDEQKALVDELLVAAETESLSLREFSLAQSALSSVADNDSLGKFAADGYRRLAKAAEASGNAQLVARGKKLVGAARRAELTGNTMDVKGTRLDGKPFNWADYRGKVVLVDFWATWCGPCIAELPNVLANYEKYHAQGFDVVGVSLDNDLSELKEFVKKREIPWANLVGDKGEAVGWEHPLADYYGISGIPATILVGRDGKVIAQNVRGEALGELLKKHIGDAASKKGDQ